MTIQPDVDAAEHERPLQGRALMQTVMHKLANEIGERTCGSAADHDAGVFLAEQLAALGLDVRRQAVPFVGWELTRAPRLVLGSGAGAQELAAAPLMYSGSTPPDGVSGRLVRKGTVALIAGLYEYPLYELVGDDGDELARIVVHDQGDSIPLINPRPRYPVPTVVVAGADERVLADHAARGDAATVSIGARSVPDAVTHNVIARLGPLDATDRIVISAHRDSPLGSPGAYDNASGVAALFGIVERLRARRRPADLAIDVIAMAGEELGFVGSRFYADDQQDRGLIDGIRACINLDMVSGGERLWAWAGGDEFRARVARLVEEHPSAAKHPRETGASRPGSDDWPFRELGVSTACFLFWKQPEYHTAADTPALVDWEKVETVIDLVLALVDEVLDKP